MIWSIVHTPEMQDGTPPTFRFYQEVIGKENIRLAVVDEDDRLDFVSKDDMVLVRTANRRLWKTIHSKTSGRMNWPKTRLRFLVTCQIKVFLYLASSGWMISWMVVRILSSLVSEATVRVYQTSVFANPRKTLQGRLR